MRAVVTGGAGFLGSHLCDKLLAEGWDVLAVDNFITGAKGNLSHLTKNKKFKFQKADVSRPLKVAGKVGYVLHFASPALSALSRRARPRGSRSLRSASPGSKSGSL